MTPTSSPSLKQIASVFFRLGSTGFGGPTALISMMEEECCSRRKWIPLKAFHEAFVICKMLPGPIAFQMALWVGQTLKGTRGGLIAGVSFLVTSALLILGISAGYGEFSTHTGFERLLDGMRSAALVVIFDSVVRMAEPYRKEARAFAIMLIGCLLMWFYPRLEPLFILGAGLVGILLARKPSGLRSVGIAPGVALLWQLFWTHFKAGAFTFGTGLAIIPVLEEAVVGRFAWLSHAEFLDGIAFGQITPGPVTITSVFIGFRTASFPGALVSLLGMYLPGVLFILAILPGLRRKIEGKSWLREFQSFAIPMVIGCLVGASLGLAHVTLTAPPSWIVFAGMAAIAWRFHPPGWLLILMGMPLGLLVRLCLGL